MTVMGSPTGAAACYQGIHLEAKLAGHLHMYTVWAQVMYQASKNKNNSCVTVTRTWPATGIVG